MKDILKDAIPALIALIGTVLAILIGYRQWKRQQDASRESDFKTQKQNTYKELWEKLEDIHVRLRTEFVRSDEFSSLIRDVNSYILKHGPYLESDDQALANRYLSRIRDFTGLIAISRSAEAQKAFDETTSIPEDVILQLERWEIFRPK